jgi:hypothetical protein
MARTATLAPVGVCRTWYSTTSRRRDNGDRAAVDDGDIDLAEAGRRLLAIHRAETRDELRRLLSDLEPAQVAERRGPGRRVLRWVAIGAVVLVVLAALLLLAWLPGADPLDAL